MNETKLTVIPEKHFQQTTNVKTLIFQFSVKKVRQNYMKQLLPATQRYFWQRETEKVRDLWFRISHYFHQRSYQISIIP